jgi:hypothetical protein
MVERTSTGAVPWTLVEANDKNHARVKILRTLCERLEAEFGRLPAAGRRASAGKVAKTAKRGRPAVKSAKA